MINDFIKEFKKTEHYLKLITDENVVCIYIAGSNCTGLVDEKSDYDIIILTLDDEYIDMSQIMYLKYKGKKVHWYYYPIKEFFELKHTGLALLCPIQLRNFSDDLVIYKNTKYEELLNKILSFRTEISTVAIYKFFETQEFKINKVIEQNDILTSDYTKYFYHLCFCVYCLLNKPVDAKFLKELKNILQQDISEPVKKQTVEYLKLGLEYLKNFPLDYEKELSRIYHEIYK